MLTGLSPERTEEFGGIGDCGLMAVRPTLWSLFEGLGLPVPLAQVRLDRAEHPLLVKAGEQSEQAAKPHERIRWIDDVVLLRSRSAAGVERCSPVTRTTLKSATDWSRQEPEKTARTRFSTLS